MVAEVEIFKLFVLVLVRVSGLFVSAPVLGSGNFPVMVKVGLSGLTALLLTPVLPALDAPLPADTLAFGGLAAGEFLIGLIIGFVAGLVFAAVQMGGQIIDMQSGFGMVNVFNPAAETQFPVFGFFLFILSVFYLLVIDGHHMFLRALAATYNHVPVGGFVVRPRMLLEVSQWGHTVFVDGLTIGAPIAAAMLLAYTTMGLLGRVVPQIHLFVVGFPFTMGLALLLVGLSVGLYLRILDGMMAEMFQRLSLLVRAMG